MHILNDKFMIVMHAMNLNSIYLKENGIVTEKSIFVIGHYFERNNYVSILF